MPLSRVHILAALFLFLILHLVSAVSFKEHVVDDANPAIIYTTDGTMSSSWTSEIPFLQPDKIDTAQLYAGTVHTGRGAAKASFNFTGISLNVYFLLPSIPALATLPTFTIDGEAQPDRLDQILTSSDDSNRIYHALIFSTANLTNTPHVLEITGVTGEGVMLDYITYTQERTLPHLSKGATVAIYLVSFFVFGVLFGMFVFWINQRRLWARVAFTPALLESDLEVSKIRTSESDEDEGLMTTVTHVNYLDLLKTRALPPIPTPASS